jgi:Fe-S-cluster containining protein
VLPADPVPSVSAPLGDGAHITVRVIWRRVRRELYKAIGEPTPTTTTTLDLIRQDADALGRFVKQNADPKPTCAGAGCSACCRGVVPVSVREAKDIAASLTFDQAQAVRAARLARRTWVSRCPLLTADGVCGVYDRRPVSCRLHFSTEPPERCDNDGPPVALQPKAVQGDVLLGLVAADGIGDLTPMLAAELEAPGLGAEAFTRAHGDGLPDRIRPTGLMGIVCR